MSIATNHTLLGVYVGSPDNSSAANDAATSLQYGGFLNTMGQTPAMMDTYVDLTLNESLWVDDANWAASSWKSDAWDHSLIPVIGITMAAQGENADQSFKNIISGSEDSIYNGIFQAWVNNGYTQLYIRPGWEMNGSWMPWAVTAANAADFVAAFQHIASLAHSFTGASIQVVWNPNNGSTPVPISAFYPGNAAVDIIGLDIYGAPIGTDSSPTDTSTDPSDFTLTDALALAKANGKPFALPETGGANASFATALASVVAKSGVPVAFVNLWDINDGNGNLSWSNPGDNQATAAAWKAAFQTIANASNALTDSSTTTTTTTTAAATTYSGAVSINDTVVKAGSTAAITDASGNKWTITTGGQVAVNGVADKITGNVTELAYVNGTIWQENTANAWWGETQPNDAWANTQGTSTSPLPAMLPPSANDTVVKAGSTAAIIDASNNRWTITAGGQVAVNGTVDKITGNVTELAYVKGMIWQENSASMWWGETQPNDAWANTQGTSTSPLPVVSPPSANDTVVKAGSSAAITDASHNQWTITAGGQVAVNAVVDAITGNVSELAYVNGVIWQENSASAWWGETQPNDAWANTQGTLFSPLPSANYTVLLAGSAAAITDTATNHWTITAGGQVAVNGTIDKITGNVVELAYVNGTIWQENSAKAWWGETQPNDAWANTQGTSASPLPSSITIPASQVSATIALSQISVLASAGDHLVFIVASNDNVQLSGGTETITDTGSANTYIVPAAGKGYEVFTSNILTNPDTLDLRTALAATNWQGGTKPLTPYLSLAVSNNNAILSIAPTAGGTGTPIAAINGATSATLTTLLAHAII